MSEFDYINKHYGLSIKRGSRVEYTGSAGREPRVGSVTSSDGAHIHIRFDDSPKGPVGPFHPTWEMRYLDAAGAQS